mmetsp:Transcript_24233/g.39817  ORF Transcript_24233/g.39817 Transcript_24233/m.39817 type:complete len:221 (-) Transcript_24233:802-1464(-)
MRRQLLFLAGHVFAGHHPPPPERCHLNQLGAAVQTCSSVRTASFYYYSPWPLPRTPQPKPSAAATATTFYPSPSQSFVDHRCHFPARIFVVCSPLLQERLHRCVSLSVFVSERKTAPAHVIVQVKACPELIAHLRASCVGTTGSLCCSPCDPCMRASQSPLRVGVCPERICCSEGCLEKRKIPSRSSGTSFWSILPLEIQRDRWSERAPSPPPLLGFYLR